MTKVKHKVEDISEEGDYKLLCFTPKFLQCFNNAKGFLTMYCIFAVLAGTMIGGVTNANIAALERRFGLDSSQSAIVVVSYDIAFCLITVFVTYFGAKSNIPRLIAVGAASFGIGALIYALPHFTTPLYNYGVSALSDVCTANSEDCSLSKTDLQYNLYVLVLGQVLMGFGATPLYTLGISFIEDSVSKNKAPVYIGLANACSLFGPVIGFTCGGAFLTNFYVDFDDVNQGNVGFDSTDPRWVGAWWVAPLAVMAFCFSIIIPFFGFPKQLPGTETHRSERVSEAHVTNKPEVAERLGKQNTLQNFPFAVATLMKNPVFVLILFAGCLSGGTVSGATSFLSKFVQNEFHQTAGNAAIIAGAVLVPAAACGHLAAGIVISKFKWKTFQIMVYSMVCCFVVAALTPGLLLNCENANVAGIITSYRIDMPTENERGLVSACNVNCSCQEEFYVPSCGTDDLTYFSPCHAGCLTVNYNNITGEKEYSDCACISQNLGSDSNISSSLGPGYCQQSCSKIYGFLPLIFLVAFFIFQSHTAATVITFRIVPEALRAFAVGLAWLFFRALGTIPGPILFGKFIDATCILWQTRQCDSQSGSCWIYDSDSMAVTFLILALVGNLLSGVAFGIMLIVYKPPDLRKETAHEEQAESKRKALRPNDNPAFTDIDLEK